MDQNVFEALKRIYAASPEIVLLMDEYWRVLWQNQPLEVGYLPQIAGVLPEGGEPCSRTVEINGCLYALQILSSPEDGLRIATLSQKPLETIPLDVDTISHAAHSVRLASVTMHTILEENEMYEGMELVTSLIGNSMRIYRPACLQKELDRMNAGNWERSVVCVQHQLVNITEKIRKVLSRCADVELSLSEGMTPIYGDQKALSTAVLCAVAICYHDRDHRLELNIVQSEDRSGAAITVTLTPTADLRNDTRYSVGDFGATYAEKCFLDAFCRHYEGKWLEGSSGQSHFCRITLPTIPFEHFSFSSQRHECAEDPYFSNYSVLLGRICFPIA